MAKVLISFLGTGRIKKDTPFKKDTPSREYEPTKYHSSREYEKTTYRIDDVDYDCTFVSIALRKHFDIDKLILIGTTHSMWEDVYREYTQPQTVYNIWDEIGKTCDKNNYKSELTIPHKEKIEAAMGKGSQAILVKYGINAEEIQQNSEIILGLEKSLKKGDELYVDITHSFRSLPLYIMNLLVYLRDVSSKKIKISGIYYGMLEATRDLGYTPIVDLSDVLNVSSWISGAYSFMEFGNAYKIASLIDNVGIIEPKRFSEPLRGFTDAKNLNHLAELENQIQRLQVLHNTNDLPHIARMVIDPVVKDFLSSVKMGSGKYKHSDFQYKLAIWQKRNHNYAAAYISLNEAILTRACEFCKLDSGNFDHREYTKVAFRWARGRSGAQSAKAKLKEANLLEHFRPYYKDLKDYDSLYNKVANNRNAIAHNLRDQNGRATNSVANMICELDTFLDQYKTNL